MSALIKATEDCQKGSYSKSEHSFEILHNIDTAKVMLKMPWINRAITLMFDIMLKNAQNETLKSRGRRKGQMN
jgi:hypothetical protein